MLNDEIARTIKQLGYAKKKLLQIVQNKEYSRNKKLGVERIKPTRKGKGSVVQGIQF